MTTRWFVEVSPVDAETLKERYCVEALQWQQALQQARKLRGDHGALSRFAIELLESTYRATDPLSKLRYLVSRAPLDAPLSGAAPSNGAANAAPPPAPAVSLPRPSGNKSRPPPADFEAAPSPGIAPVFPAPAAVPTPLVEPAHEIEPVPSLPGLELISKRHEEPSSASPIVYREYAFAVVAELTPKDVERYLRAAWEQARTALSRRTTGKFVQIALFDHRFSGRPARPPVGVLAWKDWRGDPVVQIRGAAPTPVAVQSAAPIADPPVSAEGPRFAIAPPPSSDLVPAAFPAIAPLATEPAPAGKSAEAAAAPRARTSLAPGARGSVRPPPNAVRRRTVQEDLIGELFEEMHQLRFMPDIVAGAEYVLNVLMRVMPCQGVLVHVFDINTRQFVVVRAIGPRGRAVLLQRTPDTFKLFRDAFRHARSVHYPRASEIDAYRGGRFELLGVEVKVALCGPVNQGGRYLGILELVNPEGDTPFHEGEINAVDYICEQFADFVASRPIVLDEDLVLPRT